MNNMPTRAEYQRSHKKTKKHFYKSWWFWGIIIIVLLAAGGLAGMKMTNMGPFSQTETKTSQKSSSSSKSTTKTKSNSSKKNKGITLNDFNGIYLSQSDGFSPEQLENVFGKPANTTEGAIQTLKTSASTWSNIANSQLGANMTVNFSNGHAINKTISGLKVKRASKLGLADFNKIESNQTIADVINQLGKPNGYTVTNINGANSTDLTYSSDINGDTGANFIINFTNDKANGKSQTGLE